MVRHHCNVEENDHYGTFVFCFADLVAQNTFFKRRGHLKEITFKFLNQGLT